MNLLSVEGITKTYGERLIFKPISFGISKGQKIALIAKNGHGKTTILNILAKNDKPDNGKVVYRKGIQISYLPQEPDLNSQSSLEEIILTSENDIINVIAEYEKALKNPKDTNAYESAFDAMDQNEAWDFETQYRQLLSKLKLGDLTLKVSSLSGGQKKRLALCRALLEKPDLLILDEPTNHLDMEMIEWLESYFIKEKITLLMVTHDRYFIERVCNEIIELDQGKLYTYKGSYKFYLEKRSARLEQEFTEAHKIKRHFKRELEWMRRQPKARTTKSKSRIEDFNIIKAKSTQRRQEHQIQLEINMERQGSKIIEMHKVSKAFVDNVLLKNFSYNFQRNDRIGIIGNNGSGKSTFLNLLTENLSPDSGKIIRGDTLKFGYYHQEGIRVKEGQKVIEVIQEFGEYIPLKKGRKILAKELLERFLFDRNKQYDYVKKLSGGELKRLYLCTVLIQNPNFLILDEPTNDLDIVTLNVLESFLLDFPGCLIVVSHDRYFMDKIVDHLFVFRGDGVIENFPGNYSDFRDYESMPILSDTDKKKSKNDWKKIDDKKNIIFYQEKEKIKKLEKEINDLEKQKANLLNQFMDENIKPEDIKVLTLSLKYLEETLETKTEEWIDLSEIIK